MGATRLGAAGGVGVFGGSGQRKGGMGGGCLHLSRPPLIITKCRVRMVELTHDWVIAIINIDDGVVVDNDDADGDGDGDDDDDGDAM